jgi:hypothetical protein
VNVHHDDEARKTKNDEMPPTWRAKCRSGFTTLPPVPLLEQYRCGFLLEGLRSPWSWLSGNTVDTRIYVVQTAGA